MYAAALNIRCRWGTLIGMPVAVVSAALVHAAEPVPLLEGGVTPTLQADTVWIQKHERKLHLVRNQTVVRTFPIALGQNPLGHKQYEGDSRTPEGLYRISRRKQISEYYRSLEISYPNAMDLELAAARGVEPGGQIMIHGEPDDALKKIALKKDWTQGCIALKNQHMRIVWKATLAGARVLIEP